LIDSRLFCSSRYRQPGDSILTPLLVAGLPRDETNVPKPEMARRRAVGRCRVYARLIVNGHPIGQAVDCPLRQDFSLDFRDVFTLQVLRWPESVKVQLWEKGLRDTLIAEVSACF
jgi:coiled-coil and C2 domain-containing protein 2A